MCLILLAYRFHPDYSLIVAANRDEYYNRPTEKAHFWEDHPYLLAGRDMKYGGTWMGMTTSGRFAAVTNFRDRTEFREHPLSRGILVNEYLTSHEPPQTYLRGILPGQDKYNGFNLLLGDLTGLLYYSNRGGDKVRSLKPGIYGLSNHLLDTPWPKVVRSRLSFMEVLKKRGSPGTDGLFGILSDRTPADDDELPDTGFGQEWEKILSPPFISSPTYGTRTSTILMIRKDRHVSFMERSFTGPEDHGTVVNYEFQITGYE